MPQRERSVNVRLFHDDHPQRLGKLAGVAIVIASDEHQVEIASPLEPCAQPLHDRRVAAVAGMKQIAEDHDAPDRGRVDERVSLWIHKYAGDASWEDVGTEMILRTHLFCQSSWSWQTNKYESRTSDERVPVGRSRAASGYGSLKSRSWGGRHGYPFSLRYDTMVCPWK